jgi:hypothetical protein
MQLDDKPTTLNFPNAINQSSGQAHGRKLMQLSMKAAQEHLVLMPSFPFFLYFYPTLQVIDDLAHLTKRPNSISNMKKEKNGLFFSENFIQYCEAACQEQYDENIFLYFIKKCIVRKKIIIVWTNL